MAKLNLNEVFDKDVVIENPNLMLGKGLMMPFNGSNSGSRKLMFGTHLEQRLPLCNPDVPYIQTGYEKQFGEYSSSFITAKHDYEIFDKIFKYDFNPNFQYYLIAIDHEDKVITVFEKKAYKHVTESYGYTFSNNGAINYAEPGTVISKGTTIIKSQAFDEYENRMDGKNFLTMYTACEETMEDAIVISESAAKALASPLIKKVTVQVNDNEIPLNLYGDDGNYKIFPDIGEEIKNSILCGMRVEKKEESLYSLSYNRLRELMISDERYTVSGKVVDIDVFCNAPDRFIDNPYYGQIHKYYQGQMSMYQKIVDAVEVGLADELKNGYKLDYEMQKLYSRAKGAIKGQQYFTNGKAFSNMVIEITVIDEVPVLRGDKITNRYGGKGVVSRIRPDAEMPMTNGGKHVDVLLNLCGVVGRMNAGQLFEQSISFICMKLVEFFRTEVLDVGECIDMYLNLLKIVSPSMYEEASALIDTMTDEGLAGAYILSIMDDDSIYLAIEPMTENMTMDKLEQLYEEFPFIKMEKVLMPIFDSKNELRYVPSRRPIMYGYLYFYRLKQYAEEKFSVTSLSSTNIKNENTRNKASNNYRAMYARTPIRFGDMEFGNLCHMGADLASQILMIYSSSPLARQLCEQLETGDPFNIDVKLDMDSKNRNAEILNVYLKTKGLRLVFKKHLKKKKVAAVEMPVACYDPIQYIPAIFYGPGEKENVDINKIIQDLKDSVNKPKHPAVFFPAEFFDEIHLDEVKEDSAE